MMNVPGNVSLFPVVSVASVVSENCENGNRAQWPKFGAYTFKIMASELTSSWLVYFLIEKKARNDVKLHSNLITLIKLKTELAKNVPKPIDLSIFDMLW